MEIAQSHIDIAVMIAGGLLLVMIVVNRTGVPKIDAGMLNSNVGTGIAALLALALAATGVYNTWLRPAETKTTTKTETETTPSTDQQQGSGDSR